MPTGTCLLYRDFLLRVVVEMILLPELPQTPLPNPKPLPEQEPKPLPRLNPEQLPPNPPLMPPVLEPPPTTAARKARDTVVPTVPGALHPDVGEQIA